MVRVKICGITRVADAIAAAQLGASALGFVFVPGSPRCITVDAARAIIARVPPFVECVGVFADASVDLVTSVAAACRLSQVQLHGMVDMGTLANLGVPATRAITLGTDLATAKTEIDRLLDSGTRMLLVDRPKHDDGVDDATFFLRAGSLVPHHQLILAGRLCAANVFTALEIANPAAIDLARGVEDAPGIKNHDQMKSLFQRIRQWQQLT